LAQKVDPPLITALNMRIQRKKQWGLATCSMWPNRRSEKGGGRADPDAGCRSGGQRPGVLRGWDGGGSYGSATGTAWDGWGMLMGCWRYGGRWPEIGVEAVDLGAAGGSSTVRAERRGRMGDKSETL
jgi:hypothetical protein